MTRALKVYGWTGNRYEFPPSPNGSTQTREVVAARSLAEVARIAGRFHKPSRGWCFETGNDHEISLAMHRPGIIHWRPLDTPGKWTAVEGVPQ